MLTAKELLDRGYQKTQKDGGHVEYHRQVTDHEGVRYTIFVKHTKVPAGLKKVHHFFEADVQFTTDLGRVTFDAHLHDPQSVTQIEEFFFNMWFAMKADYYQIGDLRHQQCA
jgi:hypothetical protein